MNLSLSADVRTSSTYTVSESCTVKETARIYENGEYREAEIERQGVREVEVTSGGRTSGQVIIRDTAGRVLMSGYTLEQDDRTTRNLTGCR